MILCDDLRRRTFDEHEINTAANSEICDADAIAAAKPEVVLAGLLQVDVSAIFLRFVTRAL